MRQTLSSLIFFGFITFLKCALLERHTVYESMRVNVEEQKNMFLLSPTSNHQWEENLMISFFVDDAGQSVRYTCCDVQ